MKTLLITLLLSISIFGQSGKSVLTQAQKDSINALIALQLSDSGFVAISGNVKEVGSDRDYTTIQSAITAASDGDIIKVYNGTYSANLVINKSVKIIGDNAIITGTVNVFSDNVILKDLTINKSTDSALVIDGADNVLIDNVSVTGTSTMIHFKDANNCRYINGIIKTYRIISTNSTVILKPTKHFLYSGGNWLRATTSTVEYQSIMRTISTVTGNDTITRSAGTAYGSDIYINNSDMTNGLVIYDSSNAYINNSVFTRYPYFSMASSTSGNMKINNSYIEMNYPDTVSGLHVFEIASSIDPVSTGSLQITNSTIQFGNDESIRMGGGLAALTADTMFTFSAYNSNFIGYADNISGLLYNSTLSMGRPTFEINNSVVKYINKYGTDGSAIYIGETTDSQIKGEIINTYLESPLTVMYLAEASGTNQVKATDSIKFMQNTVNCLAGSDTSWFDFELTNDYVGRQLIIKYDGSVPSSSTDAVPTTVTYDTVKAKVLMIGDNQDHEIIPVYPPNYTTTTYGGTRFTTALAGDTIYIKFTWNQSLMYKQAYAECLLGSVQNDDSTRTQMWLLNVYQGGSGKGTFSRSVVDTSLIFDTNDGLFELYDIKYYDSGDTYMTVMGQLSTFSDEHARKQVISLFIKSSYMLDNVTISLTP